MASYDAASDICQALGDGFSIDGSTGEDNCGGKVYAPAHAAAVADPVPGVKATCPAGQGRPDIARRVIQHTAKPRFLRSMPP